MGNNNFEGLKERVVEQRNKNLQNQMRLVQSRMKQLKMGETQIQKIVSLTVGQTVELLNNGKLTSLQLLLAYAKRAGTIGKQLNLITLTFFDKAIVQAEKCDHIRKQTGKKNWTLSDKPFDHQSFLPPLFGIPISVKDTFDIEGSPASIGMLSKLQTEAKEGTPILQCFKNSGVIPFVRSNVPQLGMTFQSVNNIWGRAQNPWNTARSTGGSSGGQAGLVSSKCSLIGLGSDIGGSIRGPCSFCGLFGIKPCASRLSSSYHAKISDAFLGGAFGIPLCVGPLSRSSYDCALQLKVLYEQSFYGKQKDPQTNVVSFDEQKFLSHSNGKNKYRIGYIKSLKDIEPSPAFVRAINQMIELLKKQNHEVIQIQIPNEKQIMREFFIEVLGTSGKVLKDALQGEQPIDQYSTLFRLASLWSPVRGLASLVISKISPRINYYILSVLGNHTTHDYMAHLGRILKFRKEWIQYWKQNELDFVISPGFGTQAVLHGASKETSLIASYNFIWNVLETTTGIIPVTVVKQNEQEYQSQFSDMLTNQIRVNVRNSVGLPVGLQISGLPNDQQKVLGFMHYLQKQINFYQKHPLPKV